MVLRLRDRNHTGACHAGNLVVRRQAAVLDGVPGVRPRPLTLGGLDRVEHDSDRRRGLRVRAGLQSGAMRARHQRVEFPGLVIEDAVVVGLGRIAFREIGGQPAEGAVGVQLDAAEREPVVSQAPDQPELEYLFEEGRDDHHVHAQVEAAGVARGDVGFRLAPADLRIHDRGDPGPQKLMQGAIELTAGNLGRLRQVNVGTVVANLDPVSAGEQVARGVPEKAIGRAVRIAADLTPRRGRRLRGDAVGLEAETIHAASMAADVHDIDLAIDSGTVEVAGEWLAALRQAAIVVAEGAQRRTLRKAACVLAQERDERIDRRGDAWADVHPGLRLAEHEWVTVSVDEAGHERPAGQVVLLAVASSKRSALFERARPDDSIAVDRQRVDAKRIRHGQDWAAAKDDRFWAPAAGCTRQADTAVGPSSAATTAAASRRPVAMAA